MEVVSAISSLDDDDHVGQGTSMRPVGRKQLRGSKENFLTLFLQKTRYFLIRLVSCPVPYLSAKIPVLGGRTFVEIGLMVAVCIIVLKKSVKDFKKAGKVLDYLMALMIVLGMRSNILTLMFGVSFDRAIYVHKLMGVLTMAVTVIHALNGLNDTGIVLLSFLCVLAASYLVKPFWFEMFYYSHIISFMIIAPISVIHDSKSQYGGYMSAAWGLDLIFRHIIRGKRVDEADVAALPGDVVRITFPKSFDYDAGQYCFLRIGEVDPIEYHPMSISSAPDEENTTFHVRALGDWSHKLLERCASTPQWHPTVHIEGPYGNHTLDLHGDTYKVFLFICGGIGITPNQSLYNQMVLEQENVDMKRDIRKVIFIWSVRDRVLIDSMDVRRIHSKTENTSQDIKFWLDDSERADSLLLPPSFQPKHILSSEAKVSDRFSSNGLEGLSSPFVFHPAFYITDGSEKRSAEVNESVSNTEYSPFLHNGRPDLPLIFDEVSALCKSSKLTRVAVVACGPDSMTNEIKDLSRKSLMESSTECVRFDCHIDIFDL